MAFVMPSGNVACALADDWVACQIAERTYAPDPLHIQDGECHPSDADTILLSAGAAPEWICSDQSMFSVAYGVGSPVLDYGDLERVGDFVCLSDDEGVQCTDGSGHGFRLARRSYDLY